MVSMPLPQQALSAGRTEAELRDAVAAELRAMGKTVATEFPCPSGGRVDIAVLDEHRYPVELIEVKRRDPLPGLGQVLLYGEGWHGERPRLVVLVPTYPIADLAAATGIFERCGVELRICEPDPVKAWEGRCQARQAEAAQLEAEIKQLDEELAILHREHRISCDMNRSATLRKRERVEDLQALEDQDHPGCPASVLVAAQHRRDRARMESAIVRSSRKSD